jgi:cystathionine beta-lyase
LSPPQGTYFLWVDFQPYLREGERAVEVLRSRCGVTVGAGPGFGGSDSEARLSFSAREDVLRQGIRKIVEGLSERLAANAVPAATKSDGTSS